MEALGLRDQLVEVKPEDTHGAEAGDDESQPPVDYAALRRSMGPRKPIHWFGGFPTREMRSAEASFTRCVQLCARVAEVQSELLALTTRVDADAS